MDDGDILCHPILVPSYLQEIDAANEKIWSRTQTTEDRSYLLIAEPGGGLVQWKVAVDRLLASVSVVATGSNTLGAAAGPRQSIADQLLAEADVIRAVHERVQLRPAPADRICPSSRKFWR